jgi:hypothetical protein
VCIGVVVVGSHREVGIKVVEIVPRGDTGEPTVLGILLQQLAATAVEDLEWVKKGSAKLMWLIKFGARPRQVVQAV